MRGHRPVHSFFTDIEFKIDGNDELRDPQREGYLRTYEFFRAGKNKAILQIPVGCGKTGLASLLPLGLAEGRVLVIAPNLTIKQGLYEAMDITNRQKCFWRKAGVLTADQMISGPLAPRLIPEISRLPPNPMWSSPMCSTRHQSRQVAAPVP